MPGKSAGTLYSPCSPLVIMRTERVATLITCSCTPLITPPAESRTTPAMVPVGNCARQSGGMRMHSSTHDAAMGFMLTLYGRSYNHRKLRCSYELHVLDGGEFLAGGRDSCRVAASNL